MFRLPKHDHLQTLQEAILFLTKFFKREDFFSFYSEEDLRDENMWSDIVVFCDKWRISFDVSLFQEVFLQLTENSEVNWISSEE